MKHVHTYKLLDLLGVKMCLECNKLKEMDYDYEV